jgi:hypothetical protein
MYEALGSVVKTVWWRKNWMRRLLVMIVSSLFAVVAANAAVVGFDDLGSTCNNTSGNVPDGYGGINWGGNWTCYAILQSPFTPNSLPGRVYDASNSANFFTFVTPQNFQGAWFSGVDTTTVQFQLYSGIDLVGSSAELGTTSTPAFLSSGYDGLVDKVVVLSNAPDFFVMDDVTYAAGSGGLSDPIGTPEPQTVALLGVGLGLIAVVRRRLRASPQPPERL